MPKLYGTRERRVQPVIDEHMRVLQQFNQLIEELEPDPLIDYTVPPELRTRREPELAMAIILPRPSFLVRAKAELSRLWVQEKGYRDYWRRRRAELRKIKRAEELQILKELEDSSESVLRPFRRLLSLVFVGRRGSS